MGPFKQKKVWSRLAAAFSLGPSGEPAPPVSVSALTTIVSPAMVVSPLTGMRACIVVIELVERIPLTNDGEGLDDLHESLGFVVLGDVATLRDEDGDEITIVVPRARVAPTLHARGVSPVSRVPAEIVPLLRKATGRGVVCFREVTFGTGEAVRLRAIVERATSIVADGTRAATRTTYVARDDLAPVVLEEVPAW